VGHERGKFLCNDIFICIRRCIFLVCQKKTINVCRFIRSAFFCYGGVFITDCRQMRPFPATMTQRTQKTQTK
jgi:hypothetical protein